MKDFILNFPCNDIKFREVEQLFGAAIINVKNILKTISKPCIVNMLKK